MGNLRIDLGCGYKPRPGFLKVDVDKKCKPDIVADITKPIPGLANGCACEVYCSHVIEHLPSGLWSKVAHEMSRLLEVGGRFEFKVPHPSADAAMVYGHIHVFTPRLWRQYMKAGPIAPGLYICEVNEIPEPDAVEFCKRKNLDFNDWAPFLMNGYRETHVIGIKK